MAALRRVVGSRVRADAGRRRYRRDARRPPPGGVHARPAGPADVDVYDRSTLGAGDTFDGPAIVEERETTVVIRPGWHVEVARDGSLDRRLDRAEVRHDQEVERSSASASSSAAAFDAVELEILWQSLISTVNEQARALQRAAFSPIVREAGDLANAVFDRRGRMVAQAVTGTPGHINSLAIGAASILAEYPVDDARSRATC